MAGELSKVSQLPNAISPAGQSAVSCRTAHAPVQQRHRAQHASVGDPQRVALARQPFIVRGRRALHEEHARFRHDRPQARRRSCRSRLRKSSRGMADHGRPSSRQKFISASRASCCTRRSGRNAAMASASPAQRRSGELINVMSAGSKGAMRCAASSVASAWASSPWRRSKGRARPPRAHGAGARAFRRVLMRATPARGRSPARRPAASLPGHRR